MELPKIKGQAQQHESNIPPYLSPYKHYSVSLQPSSPKQFALNLTCDDRAAHIDYQWNGKTIAQLFTGDKKMFLKSIDPESYNFLVTHPLYTGDLDINVKGKIAFKESVNAQGVALIACKSLKTIKDFCATTLHFITGDFINEGIVSANNCTFEQCAFLHNKNKWSVTNDCHLKHVEKLLTSKNSKWFVGRTWTGIFENADLEGYSSAGSATLFGVECKALFNGTVDTPIFHTESKGSIECSPQSKFLVKNHLRLNAHESLVCLGDILEKADAQAPTFSDIDLLHKQFQNGVFLHAENGNLYKSGTIQVKDKPIYLSAQKGLAHNYLTQTTGDLQSAVVLVGEHITLDKESVLSGSAAQATAQESMTLHGNIRLEAPSDQEQIVLEGMTDHSGLLTLSAKKISATESSCLNARTVCMTATEKIDQQGSVTAQESFLQSAHTIEIAPTATITTANAFIHGSKKLSQKGTIRAHQAVLLRSNQLYNGGTICAEDSHFKADRWLVNRGTVTTGSASTIDALASINMYPGWIQAKTLTTNAIVDLNLLGVYKTQAFDANSIVRFNFGIHVPYVDSWRDLVTVDNVKAASERALLLWAPYSIKTYYQAWKILRNVPTTCSGMLSICNQWLHLPKTYSGASDVVPLIATSGNFALSMAQQIKTGIHTSEAIFKNPPTIDRTEFTNAVKNTFNTVPTFKTFCTLSEPFFPTQNCKAIIDVNSGLTTGFNGQFMNVLNFNTGGSIFAHSYKLDTYHGTDAGVIISPNISLCTANKHALKATCIVGAVEASIEADSLDAANSIRTIGQSTLTAAKKADINALVGSKRIAIISPEVNLQEECHLQSKTGTISIVADRIADEATVDAQCIHMQAQEVTLRNDSQLNTRGTKGIAIIQAENFTAESGSQFTARSTTAQSTDVQDRLVIATKQANLLEGSCFDARDGSIKIDAQTITQAATIRGQQLLMHADNAVFKGSSVTTARGANALVNIQATNFTSEKGAAITSYAGSSNLKGDRIVILAKETDLQQGSSFDANNGFMKISSERVSSAAAINAQLIQIQADSALTIKEGGILSAEGKEPVISLHSPQVTAENGSSFVSKIIGDQQNTANTGTTSIFIDAKNLDLQKGAFFSSAPKTTAAIVSEEATIAANMKGSATIQTNNIVLQKDANLNLDTLHVQAKESIDHQGFLKAKDLFMRANDVYNSGKIKTEDATIKADRLYWSTGKTVSKNTLLIDSVVSVNLQSYTQAKHFVKHSIADFDVLSLCIRKTGTRQRVLPIPRLGLTLPLNSRDIISDESVQNGLWNLGRMALVYAVPQVAIPLKAYDIARGTYAVITQIPGFYKDIMALQANPDAKGSDWAPVLNRAKNIAITIKDTAVTSKDLGNELTRPVPQKIAPLASRKTIPLASGFSFPVQNSNASFTKTSAASAKSGIPLSSGLFFSVKNLEQIIPKAPPKHTIGNIPGNIKHSFHSAVERLDNIKKVVFPYSSTTEYARTKYILPPSSEMPCTPKNDVDRLLFKLHNSAQTQTRTFDGLSGMGSLVTKEACKGFAALKNYAVTRHPVAPLTDFKTSLKPLLLAERYITKESLNFAGSCLKEGASKSLTALKAMTFKDLRECCRTACAIGGPFIDQSHDETDLVNLDFGISIGYNGSSRSFIDYSIAKFFLNYHISTCWGRNLGLLAAPNLSISANKYENGASFSIAGRKFETPAYVVSQSASIKTDSFKQNSNSRIVSDTISLETKEITNTGTFNGDTSLKFTGNPDQLNHIGTITGEFAYSGPVAYQDGTNIPSADELAVGHGSWGRVVDPKKISCDTHDPIYLKRDHDINHSFVAKTTDRMRTNAIKSKGSVDLHAGTDLSHKSIIAKGHIRRVAEMGTITAESTVERVQNDTGYADQAHRIFVDAEKSNTAYAGKDIIQTAVHVKSGEEGILLAAKGNIVDKALACTTYSEPNPDTKDTHIHHEVPQYTSSGNLHIPTEGTYIGLAPAFDIKGKTKTIQSGHSAVIVDVHNVDVHESTTIIPGYLGSSTTIDENTASTTSVGPQLNGHGTSFIINSPQTILRNPTSDQRFRLKGICARILLGQNTLISVQETDYKNLAYESKKISQEESATHVPYQLHGIDNNTHMLAIQDLNTESGNFIKKVHSKHTGIISQDFVEDYHRTDTRSAQQLTPGARVLLSISLGIALHGLPAYLSAGFATVGVPTVASAILSQATTSGVKYVLNKSVHSLVENKGDLHKTMESMATRQMLEEMGFAVLSSVATGTAGSILDAYKIPDVHDAVNFKQRLIYAIPREVVNGSIRAGISVLSGQSPNTAITEEAKQVAADVLHLALVTQIAAHYKSGDIGTINHKILHGCAGALYGGIVGGKQGAISGGFGALTAETIAELLAPDASTADMAGMEAVAKLEQQLGRTLEEHEYKACYDRAELDHMRQIHSVKRVAEFSSALAAFLARQDVSIAHQSADTALNNNFVVLAYYGLIAASTAYSAYVIYKSYEEGGPEAALKQLGIEIALNVAGYAAGKVVYRVGKIAYPSVRAAVVAALEQSPTLRIALSGFAEHLIVAAERINQTAVGQVVSKIESKIVEKHSQLLGSFGFGSSVISESELSQFEKWFATHAIESEQEIVLAGTGIKIKINNGPHNSLFAFSKKAQGGPHGSKSTWPIKNVETQAPGKEIILPKMKTYAEARNKSLDLIGEVDYTTGYPHVGRIGTCENKLAGRIWENNKVIIRLDYDPVKGPHFNIDDYRIGKRINATKIAIPFEGNKETVESLLKHLNTEASFEQAKVIFIQNKDEANLARLLEGRKK